MEVWLVTACTCQFRTIDPRGGDNRGSGENHRPKAGREWWGRIQRSRSTAGSPAAASNGPDTLSRYEVKARPRSSLSLSSRCQVWWAKGALKNLEPYYWTAPKLVHELCFLLLFGLIFQVHAQTLNVSWMSLVRPMDVIWVLLDVSLSYTTRICEVAIPMR